MSLLFLHAGDDATSINSYFSRHAYRRPMPEDMCGRTHEESPPISTSGQVIREHALYLSSCTLFIRSRMNLSTAACVLRYPAGPPSGIASISPLRIHFLTVSACTFNWFATSWTVRYV